MKTLITTVVLLVSATAWGFDPTSQCVICHADKAKMKALGAEGMYLDPAEVDREVGMEGATCVDCHLGNGTAPSKDASHRGMLRPFLIGVGPKVKGEAVPRTSMGALQPLVPRGAGMDSMIPKSDSKLLESAGIKTIAGIDWHDHDPQTLAYSPSVAEKTCGRCHNKEVKEYNDSSKGLMKHQRAYRNWSDRLPGPQNCGMWFGQNYDNLKSQTAVPFTAVQNAASDRSCNMCHPGCNDCHYKPLSGKGRHAYGRPDTSSCYGEGRASICHAGPMDRRRGAGYVRGEYSFPNDLPQGAHIKAGIQCLDCHSVANHRFGHLASDDARAACAKCHPEIVKAVQTSQHAQLDCAACHITVSGAYQFTFWGKGNTFGVETPYAKHKEYYGTRDLPTIIKNAAGRWISVKPYPMAVLNQSKELGPTKLLFRAIPEKTIPGNVRIGEPPAFEVSRSVTDVNDAFIVIGTRKDLPSANKAILWIQMDKLSHALGKPRSCGTCHDSHTQVGKSQWSYYEGKDVTQPFKGSYTIVADKNGMRFTEAVWEKPSLATNRVLEDVAPFAVLPRDAWDVKGIDFSLPYDERRTEMARRELETFLSVLTKKGSRADSAKVKAVAYHNLEMAKKMLSAPSTSSR